MVAEGVVVEQVGVCGGVGACIWWGGLFLGFFFYLISFHFILFYVILFYLFCSVLFYSILSYFIFICFVSRFSCRFPLGQGPDLSLISPESELHLLYEAVLQRNNSYIYIYIYI